LKNELKNCWVGAMQQSLTMLGNICPRIGEKDTEILIFFNCLVKLWRKCIFKPNICQGPVYWGPLCTRPTCLFFIVLACWNNSLRIDMSPHSDTLIPRQPIFGLKNWQEYFDDIVVLRNNRTYKAPTKYLGEMYFL
jgi:hypothetical protein